MSCRIDARAFVAGLLRVPLLALLLAGIVVLGGMSSSAHAGGKDYAACFSDGKVGADEQIAACTAVAEDSKEIPDLRVNAYFVRGLAYTQKNDIDHVIADMTEVVALDPTYTRAFTNRAIAWEDKGDFDRAVADYTRAIALTPHDASIYVDRARALGKKGEHDRAIVDCDKAIDIDPANEMAYGVRGIAWKDKGDAARAEADYDKAQSVRTDPVMPYHDRALSWIAKGERKRAEADCKHIAGVDVDKGRDCARLIVEAFGEPDDGSGGATGSSAASAQNAGGVEWQNKGDHTRAIAAFDEAIRLDPANSTFYFNRAKSWGLKKDYARALADLDEVVRRDPADAQAYRARHDDGPDRQFKGGICRSRQSYLFEAGRSKVVLYPGPCLGGEQSGQSNRRSGQGHRARSNQRRLPQGKAKRPTRQARGRSENRATNRPCGQPGLWCRRSRRRAGRATSGQASRTSRIRAAATLPQEGGSFRTRCLESETGAGATAPRDVAGAIDAFSLRSSSTPTTPKRFTTGRLPRRRKATTPLPPPTAGAPSTSTRSGRAPASNMRRANQPGRPPGRQGTQGLQKF